MGIKSPFRAIATGVAVALSATVPQMLFGIPWGASAPAGASAAVVLHPLPCTPLSSDVPVEAPQYAQEEGASGGTDQWWCQLPHATELPPQYKELRRLVAPLGFPYALYYSYYGVPTTNRKTGTPTEPAGRTGVVVTVDWNSTVQRQPTHLTYPAPIRGPKVRVAKGVNGVVVVTKTQVSVVWRYPLSGVPKYLSGVATVTVTGTRVPRAVVLDVARHVKPD